MEIGRIWIGMRVRDVFRENVYTFSNFLSILRVLLLAPFLYLNQKYSQVPDFEVLLQILLLIAVAAFTDFFDGFFARLFKQETILGRYLDSACDKIVTNVALFILVRDYSFPLWIFIFYLIRELVGAWLGGFLFFKRNIQGQPNWWGKTGVGFVSCAVLWYLSVPWLQTILEPEDILLKPWISAYGLFFVLVGGVIAYTKTYWPIVRSG